MRKILLICVMLLGLKASMLNAQNLLQNGNFQNSYSCCNTSSGIANTCPLTSGISNCLGFNNATGWTTTGGYPYVKWEGDNPVTTPGGNTNYYINLSQLNASSGFPGVHIGYKNITFYSGVSYTITYDRRGNTTNSGYLRVGIGPIGANQAVGSEMFSTTITSWQTHSISFTATQTYTGVYFGGGFSQAPNIDIDNIVITNNSVDNGCCTPYYTYTSADLPLPAFDKRAIYINTSGSGVIVSPNTNVAFQAGQYIELNPGFETQSNSVFIGYISQCPSSTPTANAGPDKTICDNSSCPRVAPNLVYSIGVAGDPSVNYSWTSTPSSVTGYLNSTGISNPNICVPAYTVTPGTQYVYRVTASNACGSNYDDMIITIALCDGGLRLSNTNYLEDQLDYYPNPTTGKIKLNIPAEAASVNISISDLKGTKIYESNLSGSQEIDLSSRESGIYILRTNIDGDIKTQKIILNK